MLAMLDAIDRITARTSKGSAREPTLELLYPTEAGGDGDSADPHTTGGARGAVRLERFIAKNPDAWSEHGDAAAWMALGRHMPSLPWSMQE